MKKITGLYILKKIFFWGFQKVCWHRYAYVKSMPLVGRPHSIYRCMICGKITGQKYEYEYEVGGNNG
jgi:hypothetical protein